MIPNKQITLPTNNKGQSIVSISKSLLVVGANGSGKTRLGAWIEFSSPHAAKVHRISAQKSLSMPDSTTPKSIELATSDLWSGYERALENNNLQAFKQGNRWQGKPAISLLNDYQQLMVYLFSEHTEECSKYFAESKLTSERIVPPETKLDSVKIIWEQILPHRELILGGLRVQTKIKGSEDKVYNASEMSDGERVIFYLIGQCLAAPQDAFIIIDEPELHLHKSVQIPLWTRIEQARPDCTFVYLTHDVDFAAAKEDSTKVWLKSYDGAEWDWEVINPDENIPEELLLEVLGSRKPIVFVEGDKGSYDTALYSEILDNFLVIPVGSCTKVIQSVKALKTNNQLHHLQVYGIIDRDRRVEREIEQLERESIFVLSVAEVENLFCTKEILEIVSNRLARDSTADFTNVSNLLFNRFQGELETQISLRVASEIKFRLGLFDEGARGEQALSSSLQSLIAEIDVSRIYVDTSSLFNAVLQNRDYDQLLSLYNRKSLSRQISADVGVANQLLAESVIRLVRGECKEQIKGAFKRYFGGFAEHM